MYPVTQTPLEHATVLQDAAATGNGTAVDLKAQCRETRLYVEWSAGVTAGVVTFETSKTTTYTGTWDSLGTSSFSASAADTILVTGPLAAVRARISTAVVGGTVSCYLYSN